MAKLNISEVTLGNSGEATLVQNEGGIGVSGEWSVDIIVDGTVPHDPDRFLVYDGSGNMSYGPPKLADLLAYGVDPHALLGEILEHLGKTAAMVVRDGGRAWFVPDGLDLNRVREFEQAVAGTPPGDPERLVYADWCEINGWSERAEALRG